SAVAVIRNLTVNLLLIPRYGALGAAIGTAATLVAYNVFKQIGLWLATGVTPFDRRYTKLYSGIAVVAAALLAAGHVLRVGTVEAFGLAAFGWALGAWAAGDQVLVW